MMKSLWADGYIAVDWGTTNRRAYRVSSSGVLTGEFEDDRGAATIDKGCFPDEIEAIRRRLGEHPLILAGMVGSSAGWIKAPYRNCPVGADELANALVLVDDSTFIVPGVAFSGDGASDVMRGEEVQIIGALDTYELPVTCTLCQPGTHNKWVRAEGNRIAAFRTVMTGDLYGALRHRSILSDLLSTEPVVGPTFADGVRYSLARADITAELFSARARVLLGQHGVSDAASYVSGLLIGADVRTGLAWAGPGTIWLLGGGSSLTSLYENALTLAGRAVNCLPSREAFLAGVRKIITATAAAQLSTVVRMPAGGDHQGRDAA
jgi:2-dehydro-3-deoxygalactonokinase